jgi:recombinational DNA repair protein (RecF pathway)
MVYATYTTDAIVCGTFARNTADASYLLFTRDAGMLYADAKSVREERSRQRYALQDFSLARVSLVKGKGGWRIGSIQSEANFYHQANDKTSRGQVVSLVRLLRRFLRGEEAHESLFDFVVTGLRLITTATPTEVHVTEMIQLRVLAELGYVDLNQLPKVMRDCAVADLPQLVNSDHKTIIDHLYTQAISSSQL